MKKGLLLFLGLFMVVSTAEATEGIKPNSKKDYTNYIGMRPIQFTERGIEFYIYADGSLDFNTHTRYRTEYYYRNGRRYERRNSNRGVRIKRDYRGRVRSVGNVYINYNHYGKVSRIGSVFIDYYRGRRLKRVGNLRINYNRFGSIRYYGQVKPTWRRDFHFNDYNYGDFYDNEDIYDYNDDFFGNDDFFNNYENYDEDDSYYYYKSKGKKGQKSGKIIKRKKLKTTPKEKVERKRR